MNKLSKEKRNNLILVGIVVAAIILGLWFGLVRSQQDDLRTLAAKKTADSDKLAQIGDTIKNSKKMESELSAVSNQLAVAEHDMPYGDLYLSLVNTIRKFSAGYDVQIAQFTPNGSDTPVNLMPRVPYRQVTVTISGLARFHELGKFVADFENKIPSARLINLDLSPASVTSADGKEKLSFKLDIVSLVATSGPRSANNP